MEGSVITKAEEVELQALALDHTYIGDIIDVDRRIVWLCRDRAEARKLGTMEAHPVVILLMLVSECLEDFGSIVLAIDRSLGA